MIQAPILSEQLNKGKTNYTICGANITLRFLGLLPTIVHLISHTPPQHGVSVINTLTLQKKGQCILLLFKGQLMLYNVHTDF